MGSKTDSPGIGVGILLEQVVGPHCRHAKDQGPGEPSKGFQQGVIDSIEAEDDKCKIDDEAPAATRDSIQYLSGILGFLSTRYGPFAVYEVLVPLDLVDVSNLKNISARLWQTKSCMMNFIARY